MRRPPPPLRFEKLLIGHRAEDQFRSLHRKIVLLRNRLLREDEKTSTETGFQNDNRKQNLKPSPQAMTRAGNARRFSESAQAIPIRTTQPET